MRFLVLLLLFILSACQRAIPLATLPDFEEEMIPSLKKTLRPIAFDSVQISLKRGTDYVAYPYWRWSFDYVDLSLLDSCNVYLKNRFGASLSQWSSGAKDFGHWEDEAAGFVQDALIETGYDVVVGKASFKHKKERKRAELLLSANITEIKSNICNVFNVFYFKDADLIAGNASIRVQWEVYDTLRDQVVGTFESVGLGVVEKPTQEGNRLILLRALESATEQLAHQQNFQKLVMGKISVSHLIQSEKSQKEILIKGYTPKNLKPLYEVASLYKKAVVEVADEGTGFFISPEGYILTSLNVVGNAQKVAVVDAQGTRMIAKVLRTNERLDVALLKLDVQKHTALPLAEETLPKELSDVFTIGNPSDYFARNTLARGTISSWRVQSAKDQHFIQATIPTTSGYAGAPLLDEYGRVLGIHDGRNTGETNFSYYIPVWDVLRALQVKVKTLDKNNLS